MLIQKKSWLILALVILLSPALQAFALTGIPSVPTGVAATVTGTNSIKITWSASPTATSYKIYRDVSAGGAFTTLVGTSSGLSFTNTGLSPTVQYYYKVSSLNSNGESPKSGPPTTSPTLALGKISGPAGMSDTVTGLGYTASFTVAIKYDGVTIRTVTSTISGTMPSSATFTIPSSTPGVHIITATDGINTSPGVKFTVTVPTLALSKTSGKVGDTITVTGSGYIPNHIITIKYDGFSTGMTTTSTTTGAIPPSTTFTIPPSAKGTHTVTATDDINTSPNVIFTVSAPTLTLSKTSGPSGISTVVKGSGYAINSTIPIKYDGFSTGMTVYSNATGYISATTGYTSTSATFTVPLSAKGIHTVTITDGANISPNATFTVSAPTLTLSKTSGPSGISTVVKGSGYAINSPLPIKFDGFPTGVTIYSNATGYISSTTGSTSSSASFVIPLSIPGVHTVTITDGANVSPNATFTVSAPTLTLSKTSGPAGVSTTVTGSGYAINSPLSIKYDGFPIGVTVYSDASGHIVTSANHTSASTTFVIPPSVKGEHIVTVTDDTNTSPNVIFTVSAPTLTLSKTSGPAGVSTTVTGSGYAINSPLTIKYDGVPVPVTVTSTATGDIHTSTTFSIPSSAKGIHIVTATDGTNVSPNATFTVSAPILTLNKISGKVGDTITVTGSNYLSNSHVTIKYDNTNVTPSGLVSDGSGRISATFLVPPSNVGSHTVTATDAKYNVAVAVFTRS